MKSVPTTTTTEWKPLSEALIPVDWLQLQNDGGIQVRGKNSWDQQAPILTDSVGDWTYYKPPGAGQVLRLKHPMGLSHFFKFDVSVGGWAWRSVMVDVGKAGNSQPVQPNAPSKRPAVRKREEPLARPWLVAEPLFPDEQTTQVTYGGLEGFTFFHNGKFNFRDRTFSRNQEIDYHDGHVAIRRRAGSTQMLEITFPQLQSTFRFSFHPTLYRDYHWHRWLECEGLHSKNHVPLATHRKTIILCPPHCGNSRNSVSATALSLAPRNSRSIVVNHSHLSNPCTTLPVFARLGLEDGTAR